MSTSYARLFELSTPPPGKMTIKKDTCINIKGALIQSDLFMQKSDNKMSHLVFFYANSPIEHFVFIYTHFTSFLLFFVSIFIIICKFDYQFNLKSVSDIKKMFLTTRSLIKFIKSFLLNVHKCPTQYPHLKFR